MSKNINVPDTPNTPPNNRAVGIATLTVIHEGPDGTGYSMGAGTGGVGYETETRGVGPGFGVGSEGSGGCLGLSASPNRGHFPGPSK